uniref:Uncharacterized protein n=1 Tax=Pelusios castaneus TaxID=367368 RepID=A0A8C8RHV3_9SAUR
MVFNQRCFLQTFVKVRNFLEESTRNERQNLKISFEDEEDAVRATMGIPASCRGSFHIQQPGGGAWRPGHAALTPDTARRAPGRDRAEPGAGGVQPVGFP